MSYVLNLPDLAKHLTSRGLKVTTDPGAKGNRHGAWPARPVTILAHHTATAQSATGDYPSLRVVRDGRAGLDGPLSQIGLGRSGRVYLLGDGLAWHAGAVGNKKHDNWHSLGIEAEHPGTHSDWPREQYTAYVVLCAALADYLNVATSSVLGHKEVCSPKGRKIDPSFDMAAFRKAVDAERVKWTKPAAPTTPPKENDMAKRPLYEGVNSSARGNLAPKTSYDQLKACAAELVANGIAVRENLHFGDKVLDRYAHSPDSYHYFYSGTGAIDLNVHNGGVNNTRMELVILSEVALPIVRRHRLAGAVFRPSRALIGTHGTWMHVDRSGWWDVNPVTPTAAERKKLAEWKAKYAKGGSSTPAPKPSTGPTQKLDLSDKATRLLQQRIGTKDDGDFGVNSVRALQMIFAGTDKRKRKSPTARRVGKQYGVTVDGVMSAPVSSLVKAVQAYLNLVAKAGLTVDGQLGPATRKAIEHYVVKLNGHFH